MNQYVAPLFHDGPAGNTPLTAAVENAMAQGVQNEDVTNTSSPAHAFLFWTPGTAYLAGQQVISPNGDVVSAATSHTSGSSFSGLVSAGGNWLLSSTFEPAAIAVPQWQPNTAYAAGQQVISPNRDVVSAISSFTSAASYSAANWALSSTFEQSGVAIQVKEAPLTPYRYGAVNPAAGSDNTAALTAWANALSGTAYPSGASGYLPPGLWRYNSSTGLPLNTNTVIRGAGRRTRLAAVGTSHLFEWNAAVSAVNLENMWLECAVAGKSVFGPGASGGIFGSTFKQLYLYASNDTAQIWAQNNGASFIQNTFQDCEMQRTATSTVVPFSVITTAGGANFNEFNQVRIDGNNNTTTPFFHFESTLVGTYMTDWTFINILGEQNTGGILTALAAYNWKLLNVTDEDSTAAYTANLIDFRANSNSLGSRNINIENSGRRGQSMTSGKFDISVDPATSTEVTIINCNPTPTSQNSLLNIPVNSVVYGTRGYATTFQGTGAPAFAAVVGSLYLRQDGGAGSTLYVKESGTGTTGWVAK